MLPRGTITKFFSMFNYKIYLKKVRKSMKPFNKKVNYKKSSFAILTQIGEDYYPLAERVSS